MRDREYLEALPWPNSSEGRDGILKGLGEKTNTSS